MKSATSPSELLPRPDIAPGLVLGEGIDLPADATVGVNVTIHSGCQIGAGVILQDGAIVGKSFHLGPSSSSIREEPAGTILENGVAVLAGAVVFAGAHLKRGAIAGDQCNVRERSVVGIGSVVGRGSAIDNDVTIGGGVRILTNCYVTGQTAIEDHAFVGPSVTMANDNTMARQPLDAPLQGPHLGRACRIGAGSVLCPGVRIGAEAFVAAGSVVVADIPDRGVVMGVPARQVGETPERDLLENWR